jgi:hypothetical protein
MTTVWASAFDDGAAMKIVAIAAINNASFFMLSSG